MANGKEVAVVVSAMALFAFLIVLLPPHLHSQVKRPPPPPPVPVSTPTPPPPLQPPPPTPEVVSPAANSATWRLCQNVHYVHCFNKSRERTCPEPPFPRCLVPVPARYKFPVAWPDSKEMIWYANVAPPKHLDDDQKGTKVRISESGEKMFSIDRDAQKYLDTIQTSVPIIGWGNRTSVVLDVGCGVGSFGGYFLAKDVLTMSIGRWTELKFNMHLREEFLPSCLQLVPKSWHFLIMLMI